MPIRVCGYKDLAPKTRGRKSFVQKLEEYLELKTKLSNGLNPHEAVEVSFRESSERGMKSILQTFSRTVKADLKRLGLKDYTVEAYKSNGMNIIAVANIPPIQTIKPTNKQHQHRLRAA